MGGSALKNLHMFQRLCGDRGLSSVILATTMWAGLEGMDAGNEIGSNREKELHMPQFWGSMFDRGSEIVRHDGTVESARTIISRLVDRKAQVVLDIQVQLVDQNKTLDETSAGEYIQKELLDARKRFEKDIEEYQESMEAAMQEKDDVMLQALKKEKEGAEAKEKARLEAWQKLNITVQQLTQEKDQQYRKLAETLEKNERSNVQLQNDRQSQNEMFEAQMQEFQKTMRDGERRHLQELEQLKKTQVSQSASEIQRISRVMEERERLWNEEKRHLQHKLDRERRIRQEDEYRLERRLSRSIGMSSLSLPPPLPPNLSTPTIPRVRRAANLLGPLMCSSNRQKHISLLFLTKTVSNLFSRSMCTHVAHSTLGPMYNPRPNLPILLSYFSHLSVFFGWFVTHGCTPNPAPNCAALLSIHRLIAGPSIWRNLSRHVRTFWESELPPSKTCRSSFTPSSIPPSYPPRDTNNDQSARKAKSISAIILRGRLNTVSEILVFFSHKTPLILPNWRFEVVVNQRNI